MYNTSHACPSRAPLLTPVSLFTVAPFLERAIPPLPTGPTPPAEPPFGPNVPAPFKTPTLNPAEFF
jgi:hypothetical protein